MSGMIKRSPMTVGIWKTTDGVEMLHETEDSSMVAGPPG